MVYEVRLRGEGRWDGSLPNLGLARGRNIKIADL